MTASINRNKASKQARIRMLQTGHCGQATFHNVSDVLDKDDYRKLSLAASGFAEGVGYHGAVCGVAIGGALAISHADTNKDLADDSAIETGILRVRAYIDQFTSRFGSTLCEEITHTDFTDDWQVRKHIALGSLRCVNMAAEAAGMITDILDQAVPVSDRHILELNDCFSKSNFHCANHVVHNALASMGIDSAMLSGRRLIPLDGGIGHSGSTCAALLGGCMVVSLLRGGDASQGGISETIRRQTRAFFKGSAAYAKPDHSPVNRALLLCSELISWFEEKYAAHLCRKITGINFDDPNDGRVFFSNGGVDRCASMADDITRQVEQLVHQG